MEGGERQYGTPKFITLPQGGKPVGPALGLKEPIIVVITRYQQGFIILAWQAQQRQLPVVFTEQPLQYSIRRQKAQPVQFLVGMVRP